MGVEIEGNVWGRDIRVRLLCWGICFFEGVGVKRWGVGLCFRQLPLFELVLYFYTSLM